MFGLNGESRSYVRTVLSTKASECESVVIGADVACACLVSGRYPSGRVLPQK